MTYETYNESAHGQVITRERAIKELQDHGTFHPDDFADFFAHVGDHPTYRAEQVLEWLGY